MLRTIKIQKYNQLNALKSLKVVFFLKFLVRGEEFVEGGGGQWGQKHRVGQVSFKIDWIL